MSVVLQFMVKSSQYNINPVNIILPSWNVWCALYFAWIGDSLTHLDYWMVILVTDLGLKTVLSENKVLWIKHDKQIRMDERAEGWRRKESHPTCSQQLTYSLAGVQGAWDFKWNHTTGEEWIPALKLEMSEQRVGPTYRQCSCWWKYKLVV